MGRAAATATSGSHHAGDLVSLLHRRADRAGEERTQRTRKRRFDFGQERSRDDFFNADVDVVPTGKGLVPCAGAGAGPSHCTGCRDNTDNTNQRGQGREGGEEGEEKEEQQEEGEEGIVDDNGGGREEEEEEQQEEGEDRQGHHRRREGKEEKEEEDDDQERRVMTQTAIRAADALSIRAATPHGHTRNAHARVIGPEGTTRHTTHTTAVVASKREKSERRDRARTVRVGCINYCLNYYYH